MSTNASALRRPSPWVRRGIFFLALWIGLGEGRIASATDRIVLATEGPVVAKNGWPSRDQIQEAVLARIERRADAFSLITWTETQNDPVAWLQHRAHEADAKLAIGVRLSVVDHGRVRIWVVDRVTGKTVQRDLQGHQAERGAAHIALAVDELVEASLSERQLGHRTLRAQTPDTKTGTRRSRDTPGAPHDSRGNRAVGLAPWQRIDSEHGRTQRSHRFGLTAGAGVLRPVRAPTTAVVARVAAFVMPTTHARIGPEVTIPITPLTSRREGRVIETQLLTFGLSGAYDVMQERHPVHLDLVGGVHAAVLLRRQPLSGGLDRARHWTGTVAVGLRLRVQIGAYVDLGLSARIDAPFVQRKFAVNEIVVQDLSGVWVSGLGNVSIHW